MPSKSTSDDDVEPYYTAKVTANSPVVSSDDPIAPLPPLACTLESIVPSLATGVFGYIFGFGKRSLSMLFNKDSPRGFRFLHKEGKTSGKSFAVLSFSYSVPLCMLKRWREKEDWKNHSVAGAMSGLVIAWGNSPVNMLGSAALLGVVSGYLARVDPEGPSITGPAQIEATPAPTQTSSLSTSVDSSPKTSQRTRGPPGQHPPNSQCASITASVCPYSLGLLEETARYVNFSTPGPFRKRNVALAADTAWKAMKPGCRSCSAPMSAPHTEFL